MHDLVLNVLGRIELERAGEPLVGFESDKVRALLIYLAVEADRPHRRRSLAGLLWPDAAEGVALGRLRQSLGNLRLVLREVDAAPVLLIDRQNVRFNPERALLVDAVACLRNLEESRRHRHRDAFSCRYCRRRLEAAVDGYRGPFLEGFALGDGAGFDAWAEQQRQHLQTAVVEALLRLAAAAERGGEVDEAIAFARRLLRIEPWREDAHRQLMRLLAQSGQRAAALHQYQLCRFCLDEELGAEPEAETVALAERIRSGAYRGPTPPEPICRLPLPLSSFVGRRRELDELADLLSSERLLTLVGPGGSGKTRLAIEAARAMAGAFADGAWFVDLAAITDPNLVVTQTAATFGIRRQGNRSLIELLIEYLRGKRLLLVLDNAEHLLVACATLVRRLLGTCPELCVLATSREALQLLGERVWQVPPLSLPQPAEGGGDAVLAAESVQLFLDRAAGRDPNVQMDGAGLRAVGEICRRLEGIPLAIELAAARCSVLSPQALAARLDNRLNALGAGARDLPARRRTLRGTIAWSYGLLNADEQSLMRALAVFAGGFDAQAAVAVSGGDEWAVLDGLSSLAAKSLLQKAPEPDG
ncbi:MAG TPA: BTAD domain-containing putative transcriptional regulator, partial [Limnochordia bacterium]|nr:BTAD domain-containing putative transcriptional regulator [Limnochordia bacterium]